MTDTRSIDLIRHSASVIIGWAFKHYALAVTELTHWFIGWFIYDLNYSISYSLSYARGSYSQGKLGRFYEGFLSLTDFPHILALIFPIPLLVAFSVLSIVGVKLLAGLECFKIRHNFKVQKLRTMSITWAGYNLR